jgi:hypothetical protein
MCSDLFFRGHDRRKLLLKCVDLGRQRGDLICLFGHGRPPLFDLAITVGGTAHAPVDPWLTFVIGAGAMNISSEVEIVESSAGTIAGLCHNVRARIAAVAQAL